MRNSIAFILGVIYNNGLTLKPLAEIRFSSVLGRIGIAYMLANIIYLYAKQRWLIIWFSALLIGYYLILKFMSAPGFAPGDLTIEGNFASYVDRMVLPGKLSMGIHDTVGFFNNIPAIGNALAGIMVGVFLKRTNISGKEKALYLLYLILIDGENTVVQIMIIVLAIELKKSLWNGNLRTL